MDLTPTQVHALSSLITATKCFMHAQDLPWFMFTERRYWTRMGYAHAIIALDEMRAIVEGDET